MIYPKQLPILSSFILRNTTINICETNNINAIPEDDITNAVNSFYTEKEQELKKFIRNTMRKNFPDYDKNFTLKTGTEEIILEIFDDREFSVSISNIRNKQLSKRT